MSSTRRTAVCAAIAASLVYPLHALYGRLSLFGAFRTSFPLAASFDVVLEARFIPEIQQAEDIAYHAPSGSFFFAAQGNSASRWGWWPAWANFDDPSLAAVADGQLWMLDSETWTPRLIDLSFDGPFITHGIDIHSVSATEVYLHGVNHRAAFDADGKALPRANSTVEIFRIDIPSHKAQHLRTIHHPFITTPNDIYSLGPEEFFVTNDHVNRGGHLRTLEDTFTLKAASRTNIVRVKLEDGVVTAGVALSGLHNANGLGHGPGREVLLGDASGGVLSILKRTPSGLAVDSQFQAPTTIDNPSYFSDPHASSSGNASAYVLGGMLKGWDLDKTSRDPNAKNPSAVVLARRRIDGTWDHLKLFEDDGTWLNGAATACILPIPPFADGRREAWLVATGPFAMGVSLARVDLTRWAESGVTLKAKENRL